MIKNIKSRIFKIIDVKSSDLLSTKIFDIFLIVLIFFNVLAVILETIENFASFYKFYFSVFEVFSVVIFTIEYMLRLWTCTGYDKFKMPFSGRIKFVFTPLALIDLLAILPFYLPMIIPIDLRFIRVLRLFRLFRLLKLGRYSRSLRTLGNVMKEKKEELIMTVFAVLILLVIASSLMYFIENKAQPTQFSSIPASMWWGVSTLTTVGYGDIYPITPAGKFLGAIIAIFGIGMFAIPAGILASGYAEEIQKLHSKQKTCPHCGKDIDEPHK
jgi:voltage-gated potassium channel